MRTRSQGQEREGEESDRAGTAFDVEIAAADAILPDTLTMVPAGSIITYPNPFPASDGLAMEFTPQVSEHVEITIFTLAGVAVWTYAIDLPPGFQHFHWIGVDNDGHPVPNGPYGVSCGIACREASCGTRVANS